MEVVHERFNIGLGFQLENKVEVRFEGVRVSVRQACVAVSSTGRPKPSGSSERQRRLVGGEPPVPARLVLGTAGRRGGVPLAVALSEEAGGGVARGQVCPGGRG